MIPRPLGLPAETRLPYCHQIYLPGLRNRDRETGTDLIILGETGTDLIILTVHAPVRNFIWS